MVASRPCSSPCLSSSCSTASAFAPGRSSPQLQIFNRKSNRARTKRAESKATGSHMVIRKPKQNKVAAQELTTRTTLSNDREMADLLRPLDILVETRFRVMHTDLATLARFQHNLWIILRSFGQFPLAYQMRQLA